MSLQRSPPSAKHSASYMSNLPDTYGSDTALNISYHDNENNESISNITKRFKRKIGELPHNSDSSMSEIKEMFITIQQQNKTLLLKNDELQKSVNILSSRHDEMIAKVETLEKINLSQAKHIKHLENRIDIFENKSICTTIELRNIPKQNRECENRQTYINYVAEMAKAIGLETTIEKSQIRDAYRIRSETIVVDFVTTSTKELLTTAVKKFNKSNRINNKPLLNTEHVGLTGPARPIYVAEMLSYKNKKLAYLARCLVKDHKLHSSWSSYGRIYVKSREGQDPIRVSSEDDLKRFGP